MSKKPLEGLVVLDFTKVYSGPYCTLLLADLGAEVIKIERKGTGDDSRSFRPLPNIIEGSGYFMYMNRNKKSIELDLKDPNAKEIIYRLCKNADIVVENNAPGVTEKLGISYEDLKKYNPGIIYGSITGFGQYGPYRNKPAYDIIAQAMGGYMAVTGPKNGMPMKLGTSMGDSIAGVHMAFAMMAAVYHMERTGEGQFIDISMMDSCFATLENHVVIQTIGGVTPQRNGNSNQNASPFNTFKSKDGYVCIAVANDALFAKFCNAIEKPELITDERFINNQNRKDNEELLTPIVEEWTSKKTTDEICRIFDENKVPVGPILGIDELVEDPHILAREMIIEQNHPFGGKIKMPGCPIKFSETKIDTFEPSARLGADTEEVLKRFGDYSDSEIEKMYEEGTIFKR